MCFRIYFTAAYNETVLFEAGITQHYSSGLELCCNVSTEIKRTALKVVYWASVFHIMQSGYKHHHSVV